MNSALRDMRRIGAELVAQKKAAILATSRSSKEGLDVSKEDMEGRDLLTLLIKANLASDIPESHRLSDEDVIARKLLCSSDSLDFHDEPPAQRYQRMCGLP